ncbi:hypothetical protein [Sphingomonas sp.]|nr:hypothetical protein [Sphingomonas sp.]
MAFIRAAIAEQSDAEAMLDCVLESIEARFGFGSDSQNESPPSQR